MKTLGLAFRGRLRNFITVPDVSTALESFQTTSEMIVPGTFLELIIALCCRGTRHLAAMANFAVGTATT